MSLKGQQWIQPRSNLSQSQCTSSLRMISPRVEASNAKVTLLPFPKLVRLFYSDSQNITLARSVSASVSRHMGSISYMALFWEAMSASCVAKKLTTCPYDSGEKIITSVDSDTSFDDEPAHPSSRNVLMEETSGGVEQIVCSLK